MPLNHENISRLIAHLRAIPDRASPDADATPDETFTNVGFDMMAYYTTSPDCGTTACIAGHTVAILQDPQDLIDFSSRSPLNVAARAQSLLGLPDRRLFFIWGIKTARDAATILQALLDDDRAGIPYTNDRLNHHLVKHLLAQYPA